MSVFTPKAPNTTAFEIKDSGDRKTFDSGMVRDTAEGKTDYTLAYDGPMFERYAIHLTKGAVKYAARNWMKANSYAELDRAKQSLARHYIQYQRGDVDEDHAAAIMFNINLIEYIKTRLMTVASSVDNYVSVVSP